MACILCSLVDASVSERGGLLMCKACYDAAFAADMQVARVYKFQRADPIADNIFLGPEGATLEEAWLRMHKIDRVLTVAAHSDHLAKHASMEYMQIDVDDDPNEALRPYFEAAFAFISKSSSTNVLVHCVSGISRSSTIVTAYLMSTRRLTFERALALVRERRPVASPNSGFQKQLREYEAELFGTTSARRVESVHQVEGLTAFPRPQPSSAVEASVAEASAAGRTHELEGDDTVHGDEHSPALDPPQDELEGG
uniref:protein-tyrosine-phosphatase n=1 Tax=Haptolina brevifila TaxID=156173 RepID=A0A7S2J4T0_9EUKA|mmetsp:Transcript_76702/g.152045  ORF Transcript_76702/g.152045 Transcript_76702/m.152045 type:complete len:254 (+) Transcript_76702:421-1182(+)